MQDRRHFLQSLIAGGATVRKTRKHVPHTSDVRLYHGPMAIPERIAEAIWEDPTLHRATGRGTHLVSRFAELDGAVWLFRCGVPSHRGMLGEIVRTPLGRVRVHCWSAALPGKYREPSEIIECKAARLEPPPCEPIIPPIALPSDFLRSS